MQSITTEFEKNSNFKMNQQIQEHKICDDDLFDNLLVNDAEFKKFSEECDDYSNFDNLTDFYEGLPVVEDMFVHVPITEPINLHENEWVVVGVPSKLKKGKKGKNNIIRICDVNPITKTHKRRCQKIHSFELLPLCIECKFVNYQNNYYFGKCEKRHLFESLSNYLIRNEIKLKTDQLNLKFFKRPTSTFMTHLLCTVNELGYKELNIEIEKCSRSNIKKFYEKN